MKTTLPFKCLVVLLLIINYQALLAQPSTWTLITRSNSSLPSDTVNAIAIDKYGTRWFGTENGLAKWSAGVWTIYKKTNSGIPSNKISSITIDSIGQAWVGTRGAGLAMLNGNTWTLFNASNSLVLGKNVGGVAIDSMNNKWVVSNMLTKITPNNISVSGWSVPYCSGLNNVDTIMTCIAIDPLDIKWMGSSIEGVFFCSNIFAKMNVGPINSIFVKGHDLWMGGAYGFFTPGSVTSCGTFNFALHNTSEMQLTSNTVTAIAVDDCGHAWVGTKAGLGRYTGVASTTLALTTSNTPLPTNQVKCLFLKGNEKWIGTTKGVAVLTTNNCQYQYTHTANPSNIQENDPIENHLVLFPNPGDREMIILLPEPVPYNISIVDFLGREVLTTKTESGSLKIDLSEYAKGIYYVRASNSAKTMTGKILKE